MITDIQTQFISFLQNNGALKLGKFTLKSKRQSPYFVNVGDFCTGETIAELGGFYAMTMIEKNIVPDVIFGPSYKGSALAIATAMALTQAGHPVSFAYDRKEAKTHGDCTAADFQKTMIVGAKMTDKTKVVIIDDVLTTADTKIEAIQLLAGCGVPAENIIAVSIAVDRQEVTVDGRNAAAEFSATYKIPVVPIITAAQIAEQTKDVNVDRYLRCYGSREVKVELPILVKKQLGIPKRTIIPACDVSTLEELQKIVVCSKDNPLIGGYKVGFQLGLRFGLKQIVKLIHDHTDKSVIYDHQKAATDIPDTGEAFAELCAEAGVNSVIFFPQAGPETERAWIYHALNHHLHVIVGGRMTHPAYSQSEGGFIVDDGAFKIYEIAAECGVEDFVVPGNKPEIIQAVKTLVETYGIKPRFWAPGFVAQGGKLEEATKVAGDEWHAIVGRAITGCKTSTEMQAAVNALCEAVK